VATALSCWYMHVICMALAHRLHLFMVVDIVVLTGMYSELLPSRFCLVVGALCMPQSHTIAHQQSTRSFLDPVVAAAASVVIRGGPQKLYFVTRLTGFLPAGFLTTAVLAVEHYNK